MIRKSKPSPTAPNPSVGVAGGHHGGGTAGGASHNSGHPPELHTLCTKCNKDPKKVSGAKHRGFIITSNSFQETIPLNLNASPMGGDGNVLSQRPRSATVDIPRGKRKEGAPRLSLHRASIVKQEVLVTQTFSDLYEVQGGDIGKGSYGSVAKAYDKVSGAMRAIKTIYKPKIENVTRLKREILIMKSLDHPSIIRLFEVYEDEKHLYFVMELCTGGELFDRIIKAGHLSERYAATIMKQVFSAIAYCHSLNIMHRDLKPENLLFADPSPVAPLKVIDWGFAAQCERNHRFTSVVGTPYYVAPEVLYGNYNRSCDLWSTGVILYILLSGYPPFHGKDNNDILEKVKAGAYNFDTRAWKKVSDYSKDLVRRLLTYDPRRRLTAAEALQHPWIQFYNAQANQDSPLSSRLGNELINKFRSFRKANKMKQLAIVAIAYQLSENDITTLHNLFSRIDKNCAGLLPKGELEIALKDMGVKITDEIRQLIDEIDVDGNGSIEYSEFIAACLDQKFYEQEAVCRTAFRVFDLDGDGKITIDELHQVLVMNFVRQAFTREDIEQIMREVDSNNDFEIDFQEFTRMMRSTHRRGETQRGDTQRGDTQRGDAQRGDGQRGDGQRGDGQRGDGQRGDTQRGIRDGVRDGVRDGSSKAVHGGAPHSPTHSPAHSPANSPSHSPAHSPTQSPANSPDDSPTAGIVSESVGGPRLPMAPGSGAVRMPPVPALQTPTSKMTDVATHAHASPLSTAAPDSTVSRHTQVTPNPTPPHNAPAQNAAPNPRYYHRRAPDLH